MPYTITNFDIDILKSKLHRGAGITLVYKVGNDERRYKELKVIDLEHCHDACSNCRLSHLLVVTNNMGSEDPFCLDNDLHKIIIHGPTINKIMEI